MAGGAVDLDKMASKSTERNQQPKECDPLALIVFVTCPELEAVWRF
jgi:hypothetical protein